MSPRAACRLEALGFEALDYVAGKFDWLARGLPTVGAGAAPRAGDVLRTDVLTCRLDDRVADVRKRIEESPYGFALALAPEGTLLGRVRSSDLQGADPGTPVEEVMEAGPSTVRPDAALDSLAKRLRERDLRTAVVTTPRGRLLGIVIRADAERVLAERR
jgi:Mg/Co/Ni transporter MgtE